MGLTAEQRNPWVMPAMNVFLADSGYVLVGCVDVEMVGGILPSWNTSVLHYKSTAEETDILVWLGDIGWDAEGVDAYCDYKLFLLEKGNSIPKCLPFVGAEHRALYWSWSAPYSYNQEPFSDRLIKPETVHSQPYKEISFR